MANFKILSKIPQFSMSNSENVRTLDSSSIRKNSITRKTEKDPIKSETEKERKDDVIYLGGQVLKNGGEIDRSTSTNTFSVFTGFQESSDTTNRKLKTSFATPGCGFLRRTRSKSFSTTSHFSTTTQRAFLPQKSKIFLTNYYHEGES